jgi:hypothetical protein
VWTTNLQIREFPVYINIENGEADVPPLILPFNKYESKSLVYVRNPYTLVIVKFFQKQIDIKIN